MGPMKGMVYLGHLPPAASLPMGRLPAYAIPPPAYPKTHPKPLESPLKRPSQMARNSPWARPTHGRHIAPPDWPFPYPTPPERTSKSTKRRPSLYLRARAPFRTAQYALAACARRHGPIYDSLADLATG